MILATLLLLLLPPVAGINWPQFRGPAAGGHSSPVIWGDRIFLTSAVGSGDAALKGLYGDIQSVKSEGEQRPIYAIRTDAAGDCAFAAANTCSRWAPSS